EGRGGGGGCVGSGKKGGEEVAGGLPPPQNRRARRPPRSQAALSARPSSMLDQVISALAAWIVAVISATGYFGVLILMAIESACIPLPSEVIMPFAGYL